MYPTDPIFPLFLILTIVSSILIGIYIALLIVGDEIPPYEFKPKKTQSQMIQEREEKEYQKLYDKSWKRITKRNSFF